MDQLQILQLRTKRLLLLMDKTDQSRAALVRTETRCVPPPPSAQKENKERGTGGDEEDIIGPSTMSRRRRRGIEASPLLRRKKSFNYRNSTKPSHEQTISLTSPPSSCLSPRPRKRRRTMNATMNLHTIPAEEYVAPASATRRYCGQPTFTVTTKSPDKISRRKKRISETRNPHVEEKPICRSLLTDDAGHRDTHSSSSIGVVSIDNTSAIGFLGVEHFDISDCLFEEDDFSTFEDLVW